MVIGIDIRSLMESNYSGVSEYSFCLLDALLKIDKRNEYKLFYNNFSKGHLTSPFFLRDYRQENIHSQEKKFWHHDKYYGFKIPNKLFNAGVSLVGLPRVDKLIKGVDVFFSPNFLFSSFSKDCKKVVTCHDLSFERCPQFYTFRGKLWHRIINTRKMCRKADCIIAVSENTKYDIMELYKIGEEKIKVIHSGLGGEFKRPSSTEEMQRARAKYQLPSNFILFLGNIEARKNITGIINAFEKLNFEYNIKDYNLVLAGAKSYGYGGHEILRIAHESKVRERIKFLGYVEKEDKPALYQMAKLFVYPSFYEGFGFPPLEAMASGTPVIISNVSSLPEIAGNAAIMVDPRNISDIAQAMQQVLSDEELRNMLVKKGIERAEEFGWDKCAKEVLSIFQSV